MHVVVSRPAGHQGENYDARERLLAGSAIHAEDTRALYEALKARFEPAPPEPEINVRVSVDTEEAERQLADLERALSHVTVTNVFNGLPPDPACPQEATEAPESPTPLLDEVRDQLEEELRLEGIECDPGFPKLFTLGDKTIALAIHRLIERECRAILAEDGGDEFGR